MSDIELGWLAGILEGEGSFGAYVRSDRPKSVVLQVRVVMVDVDVVERLRDVTEIGTIRFQESRRPSEQPTCHWSVHRKSDVLDLLTAILPLMGARRRERIEACIEMAKEVGTAAIDKTHCPRGHPLSGDNLYSHRGKRYCKLCCRAATRRWRARARLVA